MTTTGRNQKSSNMKKYLLAAFALAAVLPGCAKDDLTNGQDATVVMNAPVFYAGFADASSETKTYVNENGHLRWNADDRLTIFVGKTLNTQYAFDGENGENAGGFNPISDGGGFVTANPLNANYAVYPYSSTTKISEEGVISLTLPSVQTYGEDSFGRGANTMVAVTQGTDDFYLPFKNVCGYLVVSLYGDATIASVSLKGNNGEKLAGAATVTPSFGGNPSLVMKDTATETITVDCGEGVTLGTTKETATAFWFVVPQTTFSNGITITATSKDGESFQKSTGKTISIERNKISTMAVLETSFTSGPTIPEMVDLGLPSGIIWASFNLGASNPEEYGSYYQWAGSEDVSDTSIYLDLDNCPYHTGSDTEVGWTKYIPSDKLWYWSGSGSPDNKTVLDPEDDVAHVKLGDKWRMPTDSELEELYNNCTSEWTTLNGVKGIKFTSKNNSNSIFLPAAGKRFRDHLDSVGSYGLYWSSSLDTDSPVGAHLMFANLYGVGTGYGGRCYGHPIRPVSDVGVTHVIGISLSNLSITLTEGSSETITATISPSNAYYKNIIWSSSNTEIATVNPNGLVTAIKPGSATITAKSQDGGHTATCIVTVIAEPAESIENNQIWYTSYIESIIEPNSSYGFGANIIDNSYSDGKGVITFDSDVTSIPSGAFCASQYLESITLPSGTISVKSDAFNNCELLRSITLSDKLEVIEAGAFKGCKNLTAISLPNTLVSIGADSFYDCGSIKEITLPSNITTIPDRAFTWCNKMEHITIPRNVKSIGDSAFWACQSLQSITLPPELTSIGPSAFYACQQLESIVIPDKVTSIGDACFDECYKLSKIFLGKNISSIGKGVLRYCNQLESIEGKYASVDNRCLIKDNVLLGFAPKGITSYTFPSSITSIGEYAVAGYSDLKTITIPDSVIIIEQYAFGWNNLVTVHIGTGVKVINNSAFVYGSDLQSLYCKAVNPPVLGSGVINRFKSGFTIFVPQESVDHYKDIWNYYASYIVGYPF